MRSSLIIYHNGECSKSRGALEILEERAIPHTVRWYLLEPLSKPELISLLSKLGLKASDVVRKNEPFYKDTLEGRKIKEEDLLDHLTGNPVLLERPILEFKDKAIIGRPAEKILTFLTEFNL
jgi:arsenate reductase (glutaredoxin)